jgi:hypothetical protein
MNTSSIKRKLRVCNRCAYLCTGCPHALPCTTQGQRVRPTECYVCWHNQGTVLPKDCRLRRSPSGHSKKHRVEPGCL